MSSGAKWRVVLLSLLVVAAGFAGMAALMHFRREAPKEGRIETLPAVEVFETRSESVTARIQSQGVVSARQATTLAAEVAGQVIEVSPLLEAGAEVPRGTVLVRIDPADFRAAVVDAEAALADARLALEQERARGEQAARDWEKLGRGGKPSALALRQPHLASAEAQVAAAESTVERAKRDLERTEIRAPYDCRVRAKRVALGAFVTVGTEVAEVFSLEDYEVRLPLSLEDFGFLQRDESGEPRAEVRFSAEVGPSAASWSGELLRSEGEVDRATLSIFVVAEIEPNAGAPAGMELPPPGMFLRAELTGRELDGVVALPRRAMIGPDRVLVVTPEETLEFREVTVLRTVEDRVLVSAGLSDGERVVLTKLNAPIAGMKVRLIGSGEAEGSAGAEADSF